MGLTHEPGVPGGPSQSGRLQRQGTAIQLRPDRSNCSTLLQGSRWNQEPGTATAGWQQARRVQWSEVSWCCQVLPTPLSPTGTDLVLPENESQMGWGWRAKNHMKPGSPSGASRTDDGIWQQAQALFRGHCFGSTAFFLQSTNSDSALPTCVRAAVEIRGDDATVCDVITRLIPALARSS